MLNTPIAKFPTVAQLNDGFGPLIERHIETCFRTILRTPAATHDRRFLRLITREPHPFGNFAVVTDPTCVADTQAAMEPLLSLEAPVAVLFPGLPGDRVRECVTECGFVLAETMPAMGIDIDSLAAASPPTGCSLVEITSLTADDDWCDAFAEGFGLPRPLADCFGPRASSHLSGERAPRYFAIMKDGNMVATSTIFADAGVAGVYCVSTRPAHRGKGLGAFVTAEPLRQLRSRGFRTAILQATLMGEPVYRRLGFQTYGAVLLYVRMPPGMNMPH